jgi:hypothetical protein
MSLGLTIINQINQSWILVKDAAIYIQNNTALFVAVVSLALSFFHFWFNNLRKGKLIVTTPLSYAIYAPLDDELLHIRFPLTFYNSGAANQLVQNIRVRLKRGDIESNNLYFSHTSSRLASLKRADYKLPEEFADELAYQFAVEGRKNYSKIFGFEWSPSKFTPCEGNSNVIIEALYNSDREWGKILDFDIKFTPNVIRESESNYAIGYTNPDMQQTWETTKANMTVEIPDDT